ncbi:hypothetical protein FRB99_000232 [Tulasnella sp. 403]|nr:hypothetical protein FRB99_000232 [Tulasnella sp. 403]
MESKDRDVPAASVDVRDENGGQQSIDVRYLAHGSNGCVYDLEGGFMDSIIGRVRDAVIKRNRPDKRGNALSKIEKDALEDNGMLWAVLKDVNDVEWVVMRKQKGSLIFDTSRWKEEFPLGYNIDNTWGSPAYLKCVKFMSVLYQKVALAASQYGDYDPNDTNWYNFLWTDDLEHIANLPEPPQQPSDMQPRGKGSTLKVFKLGTWLEFD